MVKCCERERGDYRGVLPPNMQAIFDQAKPSSVAGAGALVPT